MVNLKDHYKKISENEQSLLKEIPKLLNFINNKDEKLQKSFVQKTILSIKEIFKDKQVQPKNKYLCLQFLNISMEEKNDFFIECFAKHMYNYLIQLIQETPEKKSEKTMARHLFSSNDSEQQNYSQKFFYLLLELFEYWGTKKPYKNFDKYQSYKTLQDEGIKFPRKDAYRFKYLQQNLQQDDSQKKTDIELKNLFNKLQDNYEDLQEILKDEEFYVDEFKSTMKDFIIDFKKTLDYKQKFNRKQEKNFETYDQFMELYLANSDNLRQFKKQYSNFVNKQNPFQEKDFQSIETSEKNFPQDKKKHNKVQTFQEKSNSSQSDEIQQDIEQFNDYITANRKKALDRIYELRKQIQKEQESNLKLQEQIYGTEKKIQIAKDQVKFYDEANKIYQNQNDFFQANLQQNIKKNKNYPNNYTTSIKKQNTYYQKQFDVKPSLDQFKLQSNSLQKINNSFQYQNQSLHEPKNYQNIESLKNNIAQNSDFLNSLNQEIQSLLNRKKDYQNISQSKEVIPNRSQSLIPDQDFKDRIASRNFKNSYYQQPMNYNRLSQQKTYSQFSNSKRNNYKKDERLSHVSNLSFDINSSQYNAGIFRFKQ